MHLQNNKTRLLEKENSFSSNHKIIHLTEKLKMYWENDVNVIK